MKCHPGEHSLTPKADDRGSVAWGNAVRNGLLEDTDDQES